MDDESLIRRTAIDSLNLTDDKALVEMIRPLLYDPVKAVRMEAAQKLSGSPSQHLPLDQQKVFQTALREFEKSMEYSADFAFGRYNLANLYAATGNRDYLALNEIADRIMRKDSSTAKITEYEIERNTNIFTP